MIFAKKIMGNSKSALAQMKERDQVRTNTNIHEQIFVNAGLLLPNQGLIPQDVYQEFDNVTVERMRSDDGDTFLNDLLPLTRSVNIGKLVHKFRQASDAGNAQTSMTGQIGVNMDQVEYTYDGSLIPIHDTGFGRNFREFNAQSSEGFDALIDDQRESVATLRAHIADSFLDGSVDKQGNSIVVDGISWDGIRGDSRVAQIQLGAAGVNFDFTDTTKTGAEVRAAFIQVRDVLWIDNNCGQDATYYVSREVMSNFERRYSTSFDSKTIQEELESMQGVAAIKSTSKLSGNQLMAFPLDANKIRPVSGMGINTVAMPRPVYNSNYNFVVWGAVGWEVRTDFAGNTCASYSSVF